jgi:hypothetical protein
VRGALSPNDLLLASCLPDDLVVEHVAASSGGFSRLGPQPGIED